MVLLHFTNKIQCYLMNCLVLTILDVFYSTNLFSGMDSVREQCMKRFLTKPVEGQYGRMRKMGRNVRANYYCDVNIILNEMISNCILIRLQVCNILCNIL